MPGFLKERILTIFCALLLFFSFWVELSIVFIYQASEGSEDEDEIYLIDCP